MMYRKITAVATLFCLVAWVDAAHAKKDEADKTHEPTSDRAADTDADQVTDGEAKKDVTKDLLERYQASKEATMRQLQGGQGEIHIYQLIEEIVDDAVADLSQQRNKGLAVLGVRGVRVSSNLSPHIAALVESTLITAISRHTEITVKRCVACQAFRSRLEGNDWVVSLGVTEQEEIRAEAEALGVSSFLTASLSWFPEANILLFQVEAVRADDATILWAESYHSDATTAAILRTGDRVLSRRERVMELERKLAARPYYGHSVYAGYTLIAYDGPQGDISGPTIGYRLYEKFGYQNRFLFGIGAEAFGSFQKNNELVGGFIGATLQFDVLPADLDLFYLRPGTTLSAFFAGTEGNSVAMEVSVDVVLQFRLGLGVSGMYFVPTKFSGADLGGFGLKTRASFNW